MLKLSLFAVLAIGIFGASQAKAQDASTSAGVKLSAHVNGFQNVPATLSAGTGTFTGTLTSTSLTFTYTFSGLSSDVTAAHIHFGQLLVNGGIVVFFCGGGGKPACPTAGGTITGTITAADVMAVPTQVVNAGDFSALTKMLLSGTAYVNVHTVNAPAGEIRGQVFVGAN
jgi:hypothetical protein